MVIHWYAQGMLNAQQAGMKRPLASWYLLPSLNMLTQDVLRADMAPPMQEA